MKQLFKNRRNLVISIAALGLAMHRVIYVALAVYDGGGSDTALLDAYFDRFNIPLEDYDAYSQQFYK